MNDGGPYGFLVMYGLVRIPKRVLGGLTLIQEDTRLDGSRPSPRFRCGVKRAG